MLFCFGQRASSFCGSKHSSTCRWHSTTEFHGNGSACRTCRANCKSISKSLVSSLDRMPDYQLKESVMDHLDGGQISFGAQIETDMVISLAMGILKWIRINKFWVFVFLLQASSAITSICLHLLWRGSRRLLALTHLSWLITYLLLLIRRTRLMIVILPLAWLGISRELSRLMSLVS